jgi:hypothetical protein
MILRKMVGEQRMSMEELLGDVKRVKAVLKFVETAEGFEL